MHATTHVDARESDRRDNNKTKGKETIFARAFTGTNGMGIPFGNGTGWGWKTRPAVKYARESDRCNNNNNNKRKETTIVHVQRPDGLAC